MSTLDKWAARAARAQQNRIDMPWVTSVIDDHRQHLGEGIRCVHAIENGVEYGRPRPTGVVASQTTSTPAKKPNLTRYKKDLDEPEAEPPKPAELFAWQLTEQPQDCARRYSARSTDCTVARSTPIKAKK